MRNWVGGWRYNPLHCTSCLRRLLCSVYTLSMDNAATVPLGPWSMVQGGVPDFQPACRPGNLCDNWLGSFASLHCSRQSAFRMFSFRDLMLIPGLLRTLYSIAAHDSCSSVNCGCTITQPQWSVITTIAYVILPECYSAICVGVQHSCPNILLL